MALAVFQRPLSLDEAVEVVVTAALEGGAVIDAARECGHLVDDRDIYELVVDGLADRAHARLATQRRAKGAEDGVEIGHESDARAGSVSPSKVKPHAAKQYWALRGNYEAADGTRKSLLAFNQDDVLHLRTVAGSKADGWIRVRDAMDRALSALRQHKATTIDKLPVEEKRAINARLA